MSSDAYLYLQIIISIRKYGLLFGSEVSLYYYLLKKEKISYIIGYLLKWHVNHIQIFARVSSFQFIMVFISFTADHSSFGLLVLIKSTKL